MINAKSVPNQRHIEVKKAQCDKTHLYTTNNLLALEEAAYRLQSKAGFKLYMYFAKNQDNYSFWLSSDAFMRFAGVGWSAYQTAFNELIEEQYLIPTGDGSNFIFHDRSQRKEERHRIINAEENDAWTVFSSRD